MGGHENSAKSGGFAMLWVAAMFVLDRALSAYTFRRAKQPGKWIIIPGGLAPL